MRRIAIAAGLAALLLAPASAAAAPTGKDRRNAARDCRAERSAMGTANFVQKYGNRRNAFGKCVSRGAREEERERKVAARNAAKLCKAERAMPESEFRAAHDGKTFAQFYGTNANGRNAYGKCVSTHAKLLKREADEKDEASRNAAQSCREEQRADEEAFRRRYGTNRNRRNAFGKCVSQRARERDPYKPSKPGRP